MNCVATHLDVEADAISLAPIPTGIFNDSYYILANGQEYVLRVAPPRNAVFCFYEREMMRQEPYIHPVSYTHLRAHETPEHLVCRLLLEKKNKKNNKTKPEI